jgi:membrane-bound lytic murein transglycosylase B
VIRSRRGFLASLAAMPLAPAAYEFPPRLRSDMEAFVERIVLKHDLDGVKLSEMLLAARVEPRVLQSMAAPGTAKPWRQFRPVYLNRHRIDGGVKFWDENEVALNRARDTYGVAPEVIVAIIGVETIYGKMTGTFRVIDALVTLSFEGTRRVEYFQSELEELLLLGRDRILDPLAVRGSYAGAMGWPQFMPSSLRKHAVDFDGDGRIDLWGSAVDVIGSVASYFRNFGWQLGADVALPARVLQGKAVDDLVALGIKPASDRSALERAGVSSERPLKDGERAALLLFEGDSGPEYWLGLDNFYVISRYNRSQNYALAVWQLSQAIVAARRQGGSSSTRSA